MSPADRLRRLAFELRAAPLVFATGQRIARRDRVLGLGDLVVDLRARRSDPLPPRLARPEALAGAVERWLPIAPPRRYGICLRRALILLELWSRCGLEPVLHLGFRAETADREGHAWLTARLDDGREVGVSGPLDTTPAFEL